MPLLFLHWKANRPRERRQNKTSLKLRKINLGAVGLLCLLVFILKSWNEIHVYTKTFFSFQDRVSLCSSGCPRSHSVDQAGLDLTEILLLLNPSPSAGIKGVCTTTPGTTQYFHVRVLLVLGSSLPTVENNITDGHRSWVNWFVISFWWTVTHQ